MKGLFKNRKGFAIDDFGSMLFGLGCILIALLLLFSIGKWQQINTQSQNKKDLFIVQTNRLFLYQLNTPVIDSTDFLLADKIILAGFSEKDKNELDIFFKNFMNTNPLLYQRIQITSREKKLISIGPKQYLVNNVAEAPIFEAGTAVPNFYLPSMDGGIMAIQIEGEG